MQKKGFVLGFIFLFFVLLIGSTILPAKAEVQSKTLLPNQYWGLGTDLDSGDTLYFQITSPSIGVNIYIMNDTQMSIYQNNPQDLATNYIYQWTGYYLLTYSFMAPDNQHYWVLIINPNDSLSTYVTIDAYIVKSLTITSPTTIDTILPGYFYITWTSTGDISRVNIELYKAGMFLETISFFDFNDGSCLWSISDDQYEDGSYYQIKIIDYYDDSIYDYTNYFTIETETKTITITSPTSTDTFLPGHNYITWTTTGSIDYVRIRLYDGSYFLETIESSAYNDGSYDWYLSSYDTYDGSNYRIEISDYDDNLVYTFSNYFSIEIEQGSNGASDVHIQIIFWNVLLFIIIPVAVILAIAVVLIHRRRRQIPEEIIPITREISVKEEPVKSQERELPKITYCSLCGTEILDKTGGFCSKCGASIK
ncbi:MAG: hypothetical protein KJI71_01640 [Patescibacteria group bacterium]|nr:hypothetical protein [Patescibacteria group bacterium]